MTAAERMRKIIESRGISFTFISEKTGMLGVPLGCHILEKEEKVTEFGSYCYIKYKVPPDWKGL